MATQKVAAEHLDMTPRQLKNLIDDGILPQSQRGGIDLDVYRVAYIRHQRAQLHGRKKSNATIDEERKRLISGQADKIELEVAELDHSLIPVEAVEQAWVDHVMSARAVLLSLPSKLGPTVMGATTLREVEEFARDEIYRALDALESKAEDSEEEGMEIIQETSSPDGERVGGKVSAVESRSIG